MAHQLSILVTRSWHKMKGWLETQESSPLPDRCLKPNMAFSELCWESTGAHEPVRSLIYFILFVWVFCWHVCLCSMCVCLMPSEVRRGESDSLQLELLATVLFPGLKPGSSTLNHWANCLAPSFHMSQMTLLGLSHQTWTLLPTYAGSKSSKSLCASEVKSNKT